MILPAKMSGAEKRERMAIMEAAISSTMNHPNIGEPPCMWCVVIISQPKRLGCICTDATRHRHACARHHTSTVVYVGVLMLHVSGGALPSVLLGNVV